MWQVSPQRLLGLCCSGEEKRQLGWLGWRGSFGLKMEKIHSWKLTGLAEATVFSHYQPLVLGGGNSWGGGGLHSTLQGWLRASLSSAALSSPLSDLAGGTDFSLAWSPLHLLSQGPQGVLARHEPQAGVPHCPPSPPSLLAASLPPRSCCGHCESGD